MEEGTSRGRGRGKSRGGLGKYLRARGRGGRGRPAEFHQRLLLEDELPVEVDEEEAKELEQKYSRRQLGSNVDRYVEPEPELDSEGEAIVEPEVDLAAFLEKQRLSSPPPSTPPLQDEDDDIDTTLAHVAPGQRQSSASKKGKVQQIDWDASLEELSREKASADATRDLKTRFRAHTVKTVGRGPIRPSARGTKHIPEAPPLPVDASKAEKPEKEVMQDFLDDLLS